VCHTALAYLVNFSRGNVYLPSSMPRQNLTCLYLGYILRDASLVQSCQTVIRLALENHLPDVLMVSMSAPKHKLFRFRIYRKQRVLGESRESSHITVAAFNKQVTNGRSSRFCSVIFLYI
jgi:hypothetical protein